MVTGVQTCALPIFVQKRQGLMIACPEEIALRSGWIAKDKLLSMIERLRGTDYARYLEGLL